ncbi:guanine deaminase [Novosphingobium album (ex Hu et al. 2023)]|uniref:Guanine deaminase n=1 Tax=Novosphingobium album (ex Hu et al. 2023) TaxID=2930093 RepID=A0ABT0B1V9_9SPHN|nr:guanine deaminase [Novosphingobium album (ex Hu et al. 2023)]MCJ2179022.1 guanine deaminase [Novosphingobium album (ex Hu et al. 2023)]
MTIHAYRAELLSVGQDPRDAPDAVRHEADGLLVVEGGAVIARGAYADLAERYADVPVETLPGLVVPGFVDAHVHYPQTDRIASHGEQLLDWLDRHIFPAEKAFVDRAHADAVAAFFLDELLRNGTTSALVYPTVHEQSVDALFEAALERRMRIVSGKVLMDLGPEGLRDTVASGRAETEALIRRWRGRGRLGYAVTPRFALASTDAQLADAGALVAEHPDVLIHTHLAENVHECAAVEARFTEAADYLDVYDRFCLVTARSVFAHGIHLSDRACARLHESGAGIAVCPSSNLFLGSGFFNFGQADRHKLRLGLGTDVGAGTSFSMLYTAGLAYQAALAREERLDPFRALWLATAGSAALLHIGDKVGALEVGQEADFAVLDCAATPLLARRTREADLAERLFALQILGDDRAVARTYVLGECVWQRTQP